MNKIFLIGNLTRDPETTTTPNTGATVCKFGIAVNRRFAGSDGNREVDFFNIVTWRQLADNCSKFLKKGLKVGIVGRLEVRNYEANDGSKRTAVEVVADEVEFLTPKGGAGDSVGGSGSGDMVPVSDDSLPF